MTWTCLARSIADEPSLIWKIWTANEAGSSLYLLKDVPSACRSESA